MKGKIIGYSACDEKSLPCITIELSKKRGIIPIGKEVEIKW